MKNKLMQAGLKADHADMTADVLTWSDERGYHSHGAVRVEYYSERIAKGGITVDPKFEWRETGPCSAVFEGDNGCGYVASVLAMEKAIEHKPAAHCFERPGMITESHNMIAIGG